MNLLTAEWVQKAEDDFNVVQKLLRARKDPVYDAVCFHAQQCAEKYLKAFLNEQGHEAPKIHHLLDLLKLCKETDASLEILHPDLRVLERFSVSVRYPGVRADKEEAQACFRAVKVIRQTLRGEIGLPL